MKTYPSGLVILMPILASFFLAGCPKEEDEDPQLSPYYHSAAAEIDIATTTQFVVASNSAGTISVSSKTPDNLLNAFLYKTIWAETQNDANLHFKDIAFSSLVSPDSVKFVVNAPASSSAIRFIGNLTLHVPGNLVPVFRSPNKGVITANLSSTVLVYGSEGKIDITKHNGSVDLKTSNGDISVGFVFLRNGGFCRCYSGNGNITIEIPKSVSATLSAKTGNGTVSYSNLTISNKVESPGILTGNLAIGSGEIHLETKKGNITIKGI
ncbi:MAG: DUF4097 domain-containing protein [Bacteroidetes bacterium]|nr:DUF4097 domain-containing protein [Bacteroidota bacterium]